MTKPITMQSSDDRRFIAVDAMRGLTIAGMILVNMAISPELSWTALLHSTWNGFTFADAIYPSFLFVVGTAMALTFDNPHSPARNWDRVLRRVVLLILSGLFVSNFPFGKIDAAGHWQWQALSALRLPGVLQRIGLCYLVAALIIRNGGARAAAIYVPAALLLNWWLTLHFGDLTLAGSASLKLDNTLFGAAHLYRGEGVPFDPEGLLGTLAAAANMLAGYLVLTAIRRARPSAGTISQGGLLAIGTVGLVAVGLALSWDAILPINKKIWSSSYALLNIGIDTALLASLTSLIDGKGWRVGTGALSAFGKNPLALYIFAEVLMALAWTFPFGKRSAFLAIYEAGFRGLGSPRFGSFLLGLAMVILCWLVGVVMDRKRIYIRL